MTAYRISVQPITAPKRPRQQNDGHLEFIRGLSCVICGDNTATEAAHIRFACNWAGKRQTGKGEKPGDIWCVPLCGFHHRLQHKGDERVFWRIMELDPIRIALALWAHSGQHEVGERIVRAGR